MMKSIEESLAEAPNQEGDQDEGERQRGCGTNPSIDPGAQAIKSRRASLLYYRVQLILYICFVNQHSSNDPGVYADLSNQ